MNCIPKKLRAQLANDPFYRRCCITGEAAKPWDRVQWHHNMTFAGRQVQARFAILPVLESVHRKANKKSVREKLDWIMLNRMSTEDLLLFGKGINWYGRLEYLNQKYGTYRAPEYAEEINY